MIVDIYTHIFPERFFQELERGVRNPSLRTLVEIAGALDVSVMDLLDVGEPRMNPPLRKRKLTAPPLGRKPRRPSVDPVSATPRGTRRR